MSREGIPRNDLIMAIVSVVAMVAIGFGSALTSGCAGLNHKPKPIAPVGPDTVYMLSRHALQLEVPSFAWKAYWQAESGYYLEHEQTGATIVVRVDHSQHTAFKMAETTRVTAERVARKYEAANVSEVRRFSDGPRNGASFTFNVKRGGEGTFVVYSAVTYGYPDGGRLITLVASGDAEDAQEISGTVDYISRTVKLW